MTTTYDYKVRDRAGKLVKGKLDAESVPVVATRLREMGYLPVEIKQTSSFGLRGDIGIPGITDRVKLKEVAIMSRQLATMVSAGLTLVRALSVLADQLESKPLRTAVLDVRADVERGSSFSSSLEKHPKVFSPIYVSMVKAGEASGQLDTVLLKLATQIEKQVELRSKVRSAFTYPIVVVVLVIIIVTAMMIFVVPTFKHLYSSLNGKLPLPTQIVIKISNTIASIWALAVIAVVVLLVAGFLRWKKSDKGRDLWDSLKLRVPVFGPLALKIALSRFTATLSTLLLSGIGIIEALEITADNVGNRVVARAARNAQVGVREGRSLASTLSEYPVIPSMVNQMIETGEESGTVGDMLGRVATFYDNEIDATVNSMTALLEPVLIVFMGVCVGAIVVSLYLPMFNYVKLLSPATS
jgi:type IV pilus assembly protein PilC